MRCWAFGRFTSEKLTKTIAANIVKLFESHRARYKTGLSLYFTAFQHLPYVPPGHID